MKAKLRLFLAFLKWMLTPKIGVMDVMIVLAGCAYALGETVYPARVAQFCIIAYLAYVNGVRKTREEFPKEVAHVVNEILQQMVADGVIQPGAQVKVDRGDVH